jgi:enoyl-CoA hydratase
MARGTDVHSQYEELLYDVVGPVARVTLNRPAKLNALTQRLYRELRHALISADLDSAIEVVVLAGSGRAFCAGGDLSEVHAMHQAGDGVDLAMAADNSSATFRQMENMLKPIVCIVDGPAHAAGLVLAMQADVTIASERATFRLPEALRGMSDVYAACHLSSYIGVARTKYLLLTCDEISAHDALAWGLVARVVTPDQVEEEAERVIQRILATHPSARGWNKLLVNRTLAPFDGRALKETIGSDETMSGTQSFSSKVLRPKQPSGDALSGHEPTP